jgi:di/tricarboxylate transporter
MARNGLPGFALQTYLYNLAAHAIVAFAGYAVFGGLKLFRVSHAAACASPDTVADAGDAPFERRHWITIAVIAALLVSAIAFDVHVGMAAFLGAALLVLSGAADDGEAVKRMPWRVIVMVCGVTVLISLVEKAQGLDLVVGLVARIASPATVTGVVAFLTGVVSVYSSTSGVVLPAFLPIVPGLAAQMPGASALGIAMSMNIGGHLVDMSPLSTLGALCMAGAPPDETRPLFNKLLAWGLSMTVVGAVLCYLAF